MMRVFISYSYEGPEHAARVRALADRLRGDGVDAWLDQYQPSPSQGWARWMSGQIQRARFVLMICTPSFRERFDGQATDDSDRGTSWEGLLAQQIVYDRYGRNDKFLPVLFDGVDEHCVPLAFRPFTHYRVPSDYEVLYRRLSGQSVVIVPPLGEPRALPPRAGSPPVIAPALTATQRDRLVALLDACGRLHGERARAALIAHLPDSLSAHIGYQSSAHRHLRALVDACARRAGGIAALAAAAQHVEGDTFAARDLQAFVYGVSVRRARAA
ncbi:MAG: hypothetical protein Tsb0020_49390 [Haliangiales bacterium]